MDYGYQLLRHVVQQVFGNLAEAARLTIAPILIAALVAGLLFVLGIAGAAGGNEAAGSSTFVFLLLLAAGAFFAMMYCWAAVGWHRYVLLEETADGLFPPWSRSRILSYLGRSVLVLLIVLVIVVIALIFLGLALATTGSMAVLFLFGFGVTLLASWLIARIGLVLPAAAMEKQLSISESWATTRPVASHILLPIAVFALAFGILGQVNLLLFAAEPGSVVTMQVNNRPALGLVGSLIAAVIGWFQLLINLALMTTLYGNLIEGRQLN